MHLFHRRYLALYCALFAVACLGGCFLQGTVKHTLGLSLLGAAALTLLLLILVKKHRARLLHILLCLLFTAAAFLQAYFVIDRDRQALEPLFDTELETQLRVVKQNYLTDYSASYTVSFSQGEKSFNALLVCEYPADFSAGDILRGTVTVSRIESQKENVNYYFASEIYAYLMPSGNGLSFVQSTPGGFENTMQTLNRSLSNIFLRDVGGNEAALLSAIILGNEDGLAANIQRDFQRTGTSHILAISGMHLTVIMIALEALLRRLGIGRSIRCILVFLVALFYLALTGFALSTVRAFIMMGLVYLAFLLRVDNDAVTSLFVSLFLILVVSPSAVWDIGIWLSFLAVLGILMGNHLTVYLTARMHDIRLGKRTVKLLANLISAILTTVAANVFICVPMWLFFGELAPISLPANLLVSPLISLLMFSAPLKLLTSAVPLLSFLSAPLIHWLRILCRVILELIAALSALPNVTVSLEYGFVGFIVISTAALLILALILPLRRKALIPMIPAVATVVFFFCLIGHKQVGSQTLTADLLSFGESEMLVLTTASDTVICDLSTGANRYLYDSIDFSRQRFSTEISALVFTHYHTLHVSTFSKNAERFMIRRLYLPIPQNQDQYYLMLSLIDRAKNAGTDVILFDCNTVFSPAKNITLDLSDNVYLSRSTHPTFTLTVSAFGDRLTYVAESAHESERLYQAVEERISGSDFVVFGTHGPITKTDFSYKELSGLHYVVIPNENVLSHFDPEKARKIVTDCTLVTFRMEE